MNKLLELQRVVKQINRTFIDDSIQEVLEGEREAIVELNTENQLFQQGIGADGKKLEPPYSVSTRRAKTRKSQPLDRVTLKDTGKFYRNTDAVPTEREVTITNDDSKRDKLEDKYGDRIFGLTGESQGILSQTIVKPGLIRILKRKLT